MRARQGYLPMDDATVEIPNPVRAAAVRAHDDDYDDHGEYEDDVADTPPYRAHHPMAKRVRRLFLLALVVLLVIAGWSIVSRLTAPGSDSATARIAEWARDHNMGDLVTFMEKQQYQKNQPKIGGVPTGGIPIAGGVKKTPGYTTPHVPAGLPAPATMPPLAGGAPLAGEGQWQTVVATAKGQPAVRVAALRPDPLHTSYVAGVMWIDPTFVRGQLRPGTTDPGGAWAAAPSLTAAEYGTVAATFNAGFRLTQNSSHGGYYSEGKMPVALQDGAASLILRNDGTATVGTWNSDVHMTPDVASVRQNLVMLVDGGKVNPSCDSGGSVWGATLGNKAYIDRSAFGVTATGAEVFVTGPALSVCTLGAMLQDAGVVRGMELDINPAWMTGVYYQTRPSGQPPAAFHLYPAQQPAATHYFSASSRDWFAWFLRG
jgi:hypothetical protein